MASWTDNSQALSNFNPYIQQIPIDAYVSVGQTKQAQYEQGVQKVQQDIDNVANLPVIKAEQKDYLQQRIGQLQSSIGKVVGQDFSKSQLVNQIGGLTSQIASDPIIQSAVASTIKVQAGQTQMAEAQKAGKSSIANEWDFQNQVNNWLSDKDAKSSFSGGYTPHTDYNAKLLKAINDMHPDEQLQQLPFVMENGQVKKVNGVPVPDVVMIQKMTKSLDANKIQAAISAAMGPDELNQLAIDGRYEYRGLDKAGLKQVNDDSYKHQLHYINETLKGLAVQKMSNGSNIAYQDDLDNKIKGFELQRDSLLTKYPTDVKLLDQNPEAYKGELYKQNYMSNMTNGYAYATNSFTYMDNPYEKNRLAREDDARLAATFMKEYGENGIKAQELAIKREQLDIERGKVAAAEKKAKKEAIPGLTDNLLPPTQSPLTKDQVPPVTTAGFVEGTVNLKREVEGSKRKLAAGLPAFSQYMNLGPNGELTYNDEASKAYVETGIAKLMSDCTNPQLYAQMDPAIKAYYNDQHNKGIQVANREAFMANQVKKANKETIDPGTVYNKVAGVRISSKAAGLGPTNVSASELNDFQNKLNQVVKSVGGAGGASRPYIDEDRANQILTTPTERVLYNVWKKSFYGDDLSKDQQMIIDALHNANVATSRSKDALTARDVSLDKHIQQGIQTPIPTRFGIMAAKPEEKYVAESLLSGLIDKYTQAGANEIPGGATLKDLQKLYNNKAGNVYALEAVGNGQYNYVVSNVGAGIKDQKIPISQEDLDANFPGATVSQFAAIKEALSYTAAEKLHTTDVQGNGEESAFALKSDNLENYAVRYHVEESKPGQYQVRAFIRDKNGNSLSDRPVPLPYLIDEKGLANFLNNFGDQQITEMLTPQK